MSRNSVVVQRASTETDGLLKDVSSGMNFNITRASSNSLAKSTYKRAGSLTSSVLMLGGGNKKKSKYLFKSSNLII